MPWQIIETPLEGRWVFNPDGIYLLMRAAVRAQIVRARSRVVTTNHGFLMPTTYCLETDWAGFRVEVERETTRYWANARQQISLNPRLMRGSLLGLISDARRDINWMEEQRVSANHRSTTSIDSTVLGWERALDTAQVVRDGSATILVVAGGIVSGGAGLALAGGAGLTGVTTGTAMTTLAVGSVMRGAFTYQDTGNVGSAVINTVGTFTVGAIGIGAAGAAMSTAQTGTIILIQSAGAGTTTGLQSLAEGSSARQAAVSAVAAFGAGAISGAVGTQLGSMSLTQQITINGVADMMGNAAVGAIYAPAEAPLPLPVARGSVDYGGLPARSRDDEMYVTQNCMFRLQ